MEEITIGTGTGSVTAKDFLGNNTEWVDKIVDAIANIFGLFLSMLLSVWNLALLLLSTYQEFIIVAVVAAAVYYKFTGKIPFVGSYGKKGKM